MYKAYCQRKGWRCVEEEYHKDFSINKGCKLGVFKIIGNGDVYRHLRHESGVHK